MPTSKRLKPISPTDAVEWYLDHKSRDVIPGTADTYRNHLAYFVDYCNSEGIANLNNLSGRDIELYRIWRREDSSDVQLRRKTMRDQMYLFRDFLRYIESIEGVHEGLPERVMIPKLRPEDGVRDVTLDPERAKEILDHLEKYEYASVEHVLWILLCETGRRIGGIESLDVDDFHPDVDEPYLAFRHRPERGTRLKNDRRSETNVNITEGVCSVIEDYLENKRPEVKDEYGREPLLASNRGRLSTSAMRKYVYRWSRPCEVTGECPHERSISECEAAQRPQAASKCPSSVSAHAIRHGYISSMLHAETPKPLLSERCDVSEAVIDKHYDERSEAEKQNLRRRILDQVYENDQAGYAR